MASGRRSLAWLAAVATAAAISAWSLPFVDAAFQDHWWSQRRTALTGLALAATALAIAFAGLARVVRTHKGSFRGLSQLQVAATILVLLVFMAGTMSDMGSTVVSLGIVGFGVTLALQRPILALAGWATVFFGRMFREGDRIQVGDLQGDVLDISLMTTRLWEIGEPGSSTPGRPTGRIRIVSNAMFLEQPVANATSDTPTVFDEFVVNVAFESDQERAAHILEAVGGKVVDPEQHQRLARTYRRLARGMPMAAKFPEAPFVLAESKPSWMEYRLRYLVDARVAGRVQSDLTQAWNAATESDPSILAVYPRSQPMAIDGSGRPVQR